MLLHNLCLPFSSDSYLLKPPSSSLCLGYLKQPRRTVAILNIHRYISKDCSQSCLRAGALKGSQPPSRHLNLGGKAKCFQPTATLLASPGAALFMHCGARWSPRESMGKLCFTLFRSLLFSSSHLDDIWKLMLYLGMFLYVHEDSYKTIFNFNTCTNPVKLTKGH